MSGDGTIASLACCSGDADCRGEILVEVVVPLRHCDAEIRADVAPAAGSPPRSPDPVGDHQLRPRDRPGCARAPELADVVAAVTATAHDDDPSEVRAVHATASRSRQLLMCRPPSTRMTSP